VRAAFFTLLLGLAIVALAIVLAPQNPPAAEAQAGRTYVGSEKCATCHADTAAKWKRTLHSKMVRPATRDEIHGNLQAPNAPNLSQFDFAYVIGGWYKEERYVIRRDGELMTTPNEWNHVTKTYTIRPDGFLNWRTGCIGCHTTGYSPQTRQWAELNIGCEACHVQTLQTGAHENPALDRVTYHPYSDFLLHDMGSLGDGFPQGTTARREMRTAPLWGLRLIPRSIFPTFLHDGRARTIEAAINAHDGQGKASRERFTALSDGERAQLLAFLNSL